MNHFPTFTHYPSPIDLPDPMKSGNLHIYLSLNNEKGVLTE